MGTETRSGSNGPGRSESHAKGVRTGIGEGEAPAEPIPIAGSPRLALPRKLLALAPWSGTRGL